MHVLTKVGLISIFGGIAGFLGVFGSNRMSEDNRGIVYERGLSTVSGSEDSQEEEGNK